MQNFKCALSIVPQSINDTDTNGTAMDTLGFSRAMFIFHAGAIGAADFDASGLNLTECDTSGGSYVAITASAFTVPTQTSDNGFWVACVQLGGIRKRYFKWHANPGAAATLLTGFVVLFGGDQSPNTDTERGCVQTKFILNSDA
jgi:hypothetical protein